MEDLVVEVTMVGESGKRWVFMLLFRGWRF